MKRKQELFSEISKTTLDIETNYPELYIYLDENPMTIPNTSNPKMDVKTLENYLQSLKELLSNHIKNHKQ